MGKKDARIDLYIKKSAEFAQPVLHHIRALIHKACPEVQETIKWGMPYFDYKGILCGMAAFKEHCTVAFRKGALMETMKSMPAQNEAMGNYGRITKLKDLPSDKRIIAQLKEAMQLNENGVKLQKKPDAKKIATTPDYFQKALSKNKKAKESFDRLTPSMKREYLEWITEAKTEPTRIKRMETSMQWLSEGKRRNWKYEK